MAPKILMIAAPCSGEGKTSMSIGLMRAFSRCGYKVQGLKSGPDYIDPEFHAAATGRKGANMDSWAMPPELLAYYLSAKTSDCDLVIIEGAMGLFDGIPQERGRTGAGADLVRAFHIPVLLVQDISGQAQTAAAITKGFATFDPDVSIHGVILNRVASPRHEVMAKTAIEQIGIPVVGSVMRQTLPALKERHLGLVQAREYPALDQYISDLADQIEKSLDLEAILDCFAPLDIPEHGSSRYALPPPGQRIALAQDEAFTFLYPHVLEHWQREGAEIVPFSPLADQAPAQDCDICWLPGGYPELHAGKLAAAGHFIEGTRVFARTKPVHGECGGYMVLGQNLEDAEGVTHNLLNLLDHKTSFAKRKMNLGYRKAQLETDSPLGKKGMVIRGHEFHYSSLLDPGTDQPFARLSDGGDRDLGFSGGRRGHVSGAFFHAIACDF